jgi:NADH:ubiquinone oxidoreductase subunit 3 (subunit A)
MHTIAVILAFLVVFAVVFTAVYLISGLFGPRQPEDLNLNAPEPTEAEFNQE